MAKKKATKKVKKTTKKKVATKVKVKAKTKKKAAKPTKALSPAKKKVISKTKKTIKALEQVPEVSATQDDQHDTSFLDDDNEAMIDDGEGGQMSAGLSDDEETALNSLD